jgi:uncharacterized membrane protein
MLARALALLVDLCSSIALFIIVTGGVRTKHDSGFPAVELMTFGPWLLPLALCLLLQIELPTSRTLRLVSWLHTYTSTRPTRSLTKYVAGTLLFITLGHGLVVLLRHLSFQTGMDLAIYGNACRGALFSTMKGDVWLFADHFEPVLVLFTPLCRLASPAVVLLVVQTVVFGIGALGLYHLALLEGWSALRSWLVAFAYLTFSPLVTAAYYDFHLIVLSLGIIPWLWWALRTKNSAWTITLFVLYLGLKESVSLSLTGLGAYLLFSRESFDRRFGRLFVIIGPIVFLVTMKVVYPLFRDGEESMYFAKYYGHLGNNLSEFVATILRRPGYVLGTLVVVEKLKYLGYLLFPFLFFPLFVPVCLLPIAPAVLVNILSNDGNILSGIYHYEAEIYPTLFAMALIVLPRSKWRRTRDWWLALVIVVFSHKSALGIARWSAPTPAHRKLLSQIHEFSPESLAIAAPARIAVHLTDREKLYMFDYWNMEDDWRRAQVVIIGNMGPWMGYYSWTDFQTTTWPQMQPYLRLRFADPSDPSFRIYDVLDRPLVHTEDELQ